MFEHLSCLKAHSNVHHVFRRYRRETTTESSNGCPEEIVLGSNEQEIVLPTDLEVFPPKHDIWLNPNPNPFVLLANEKESLNLNMDVCIYVYM